MKRLTMVLVMVSVVLTSSVLCGCGELLRTEESAQAMIAEVNSHYPDDLLTYNGILPKTDDFIVEMSSEKYPGVVITVRDRDGVLESNYYALARSEATGGYFADLASRYFDCEHIEARWNGWQSCYSAYNELSDDSFIKQNIDNNFTLYLYYEEYPEQDEMYQIITQMLIDLELPIRMHIELYSVDDIGLERGEECTCDIEYYAVIDDSTTGAQAISDTADSSDCPYIRVTYNYEVLRDYQV